jgi:hypothetical protein
MALNKRIEEARRLSERLILELEADFCKPSSARFTRATVSWPMKIFPCWKILLREREYY